MGAVVFKHKGLRLIGVLARPEGPERKRCPAVLFLHGFPGSEQNVDIRRALLKKGVASFALHFGGAWGSDGLYSFSNLLPQAEAGLKFLASQDFVDKKRMAVFGFSMGGWTALNLAGKTPALKAVAAVAPVGGPEMISSDVKRRVAHLSRTLRIKSVDSLGKDFCESVTRLDPAKAVAKRKMPLLMVHGTEDETVPAAVSRRVFGYAREPKELILSKGAQHDFLDRREWLTKTVADFLARSL
jgi:hypothetical protein